MKRLLVLPAVIVVSVLLGAAAGAQEGGPTVDASRLKLPGGVGATTGGPVSGEIDPRVADADGRVRVVVQLEEEPLAVAVGRNAARTGSDLNEAEQQDYLRGLESDQDRFAGQARSLGADELARVEKALNAVVVRVDASRLEEIAALPGVESVRPVIDYELHLEETVPYVGAAEAQRTGVDGTGVRVAVIDSGVDYTHRNLGGEGTEAAYEAAYGAAPGDPRNVTRDGLFPTEKVYEGRDFVGEAWTGQPGSPPTTEDSDPIDFEGHGTHVADIIAGRSADGEHVGVAPGARVLAVKACSAVGSSCDGVALLKSVDYSLDPDRDGNISDAVDVINMSLGSSYGQKEDDLSEASANAVRLGVSVVASAGNSADRPYIAGSPSTTPEVLSVAQTQVPGAEALPLVVNAPPAIAGRYANTATVEFAPIEDGFTDDVAYVGQGCPAAAGPPSTPEDPYEDDPSGKVALVDRGGCSVSLKVDRATKAGAVGVLIANNAPGDAPSFSFGGGDPPFAETLVITQDTGQKIKNSIAGGADVNVTVSPQNAIALRGSMVASSSRGPSYSYDAIKPDIGAPGASVSAVAGGGTAEEAFGGTSGAAPMVAGAAALMLDKSPARTPAEVKSLLMNTAETNIKTNPAISDELAPITRIGGGELRVDRALNSDTVAYDAEENTGSLSFGYRPVLDQIVTTTRRLTIRNYGDAARTYRVSSRFRYANDANGAVKIEAPASVTVPRRGSRIIDVKMTIDGSRLPRWTLNGGEKGGDGSLLQSVEFDGYVNVSGGGDDVHVAFHVLPHKAAGTDAERNSVVIERASASVDINNRNGAVPGRVETFALTGTSPQIPQDELPAPGASRAVVDLKFVGVRRVSLDGRAGLQFAVSTYGTRSHPNYPARFDVGIDADRDGQEDFVVFNTELGGFATTGQSVVGVTDVASGETTLQTFLDADLNSANAILTVPLSAVGLTSATKFDFEVAALDNYFTGQQTDSVGKMTYTPATPKYIGSGTAPGGIPVGGSDTLRIRPVNGGAAASPSQKGLLLFYRDARDARENETIFVRPGG